MPNAVLFCFVLIRLINRKGHICCFSLALSPSLSHCFVFFFLYLSSFFSCLLASVCQTSKQRQSNISSKTMATKTMATMSFEDGVRHTLLSLFLLHHGSHTEGPASLVFGAPLWALLPSGIEKKLAGFSRYDPKKPERPGPM